MTSNDNERVLRQYFTDLDKNGTPNMALVAPGFQAEIATAGKMDTKGYTQFAEAMYAGVPDLRHERVETCADDKACAYTAHITGTHKGELMGIPASGKKVDFLLAGTAHITNGRITSVVAVPDMMTFMQQIGAVPVAKTA